MLLKRVLSRSQINRAEAAFDADSVPPGAENREERGSTAVFSGLMPVRYTWIR